MVSFSSLFILLFRLHVWYLSCITNLREWAISQILVVLKIPTIIAWNVLPKETHSKVYVNLFENYLIFLAHRFSFGSFHINSPSKMSFWHLLSPIFMKLGILSFYTLVGRCVKFYLIICNNFWVTRGQSVLEIVNIHSPWLHV